ncbi:N-succinylarginine dihydrolase [Kordiimonas marina]|uniref:N-succinylarginine dihydrolase n=1 Tax=Kordiimonas marina TaxID=2872312 RepID=UPI001FF3BA1B|nr:N-succinylarginine dihydrolase [Kordiimonas marina]MCJ9430663.1 N-succinylarginine dihydrolase [Kordiimonas marina]
MTHAQEVNFDGLVGPTHNYGGLSYGNVASMTNSGRASSPKKAALQGIRKMRALMAMGIPQAVLPPHERPHGPTLRALGFTGTIGQMTEAAAKSSYPLIANMMSASAMWTANAATVSPSADTADGRAHFTPANLGANFHRSIEAEQSERTLRTIFADEHHFMVHDPLPYGGRMGDEGAANHGRLCPRHGDAGVELFVYGASAFDSKAKELKFPARQALEVSEAVARRHGLDAVRTVYARQNPAAIEAGAFHNDVVSVANGPALFFHEQAFAEADRMFDDIRRGADFDPVFVKVPADEVPLEDAIKSYLFNSQLVTLSSGTMALILPEDARENAATYAYVQALINEGGPIRETHYFDLRESMSNGGGPACLRLRVTLTEAERKAVRGRVFLDEALADALESWASDHYRDELYPADLADPLLAEESLTALDRLTTILDLGSIYDFQRA